MARITSYYHWNEDTAPWYEWDDEEGGFRCASASNGGITFKCMSGSTPLNANAANIVSASWTARVATASGISRDKYYFNNFCVKLSSGWTDNIGSTTISNWTVSSSSGTGTVGRSDGFRVPDGSVSSPNSFRGVGGNEIVCRISIGNSSSQITLLTEATLTIVWDEPEIVYTKPTVSLNAVNTNYAPSKSIKVSWTGTAGSNNNIAKYEYVYKTENASPTSSDTAVSTGTTAEASITTPATTAGITTSKYFYVKPYGTNSNYNGSWTGPLTISSYYTDISWGKTFKIGGSTGTIYIGSKGSPKATLYWDTASSGTNNGVSSYQFYKGSSIISTYNKDSYNLTVGQFKVVVVPEIGNSLTSNLITVKNLEGLSNPSFSSTLKTTIDKNFSFKIASLEKNNYSGVKSITQTVERIYNGVSKTIALTNNEGNCDVSDIPDNQTFTLKITATYNDNFGGYTNTTYTSATITKVKKIEVPEGFIQYIGEKNDNTTTGTNNKFFMTKFYIRYNNLNKGLTSIKYKYEMYYQIGNDAYVTNPITSSTNTSDTYGKFVFNSNLDHMGKLITFYIKITDNTTGSAAETEVFTIRSLKAPTIDSITANIKSNQNELVNFTINYKSNMDVSVGNMKLYVNFIYNGVKGKNTDYTYTLTTTEQSAAFPSKNVGDYYYSCISSNENIQNFYNSLLQEIYPSSGAGIYNPNLQLWIKIEYMDHPSCYTETIKGFDNWPHYLQETPTFTSNFLIENLKDFYNPLDSITLSRGNLDLTKKRSDGVVLTTVRPYEIKYVLNYKNSNINFTNNQIEISAPETVQDDIIQVGFITEVKYKKRDGTIINKQYNSSGGTTTEYVRFNLAKWNSNIVPYLSNCSQSNGKIEGKINFESDKIYSKKYYNLSTIKYVIYEELGANDTKLKEGLITINTLEVPISESFSFNYSKESNANIYAVVVYTNSSDRYFTHQTQTYLIRTGNLVPLALRKKGIALNVEPTFDLTSRGSSIFAAAASDDSAILELQANDEATNPKFLHFLNGANSISSIYYNESDFLLHCDKWYYPVTSVNGKTGIITLSASDVKARPSTWMPTAGSGISISGDTISNSGIRTLTATTGDSNGQIKLTINGTPTNVSVKGFSTNYLPLSGGDLTGKITTSYTSGTWLNSANGGSAINLTGTSYTGWISGNGKTGKFVISTYPAQTDLLYFGFKLNTTITSGANSLDKSMTWNGTTGELQVNSATVSGIMSSNVVKGNAIRYSTTAPTTNLTVGQIWLKPKN